MFFLPFCLCAGCWVQHTSVAASFHFPISRGNYLLWKLQCVTMHATVFCLQMFITMGFWYGMRLLLLYQYWNSTQIFSYGDYVCHSDPGVLHLYDWLLQVLEKFINELDIGVDNWKPWIWAWEESELVSLPAFLHPPRKGTVQGTFPENRASSTMLPRWCANPSLPSIAAGEGHGQFCYRWTQGQLSCLL